MAFFERGVTALLDYMSSDEADEFLSRPEIKSALEAVSKDFDDRRTTIERIRNRARTDLGKLAPLAIGVLQKALQGTYEIINEDGKKEVVIGPSERQFKAASKVMDLLGVAEQVEDVGDTEINFNIDNRHFNIEGPLAATSAGAADKRNQVRAFVEGVMGRVREMVKDGPQEITEADVIEIPEKKKKRKYEIVDGVRQKRKKKKRRSN